MTKLNLAFYWAASCGGCEISVLEVHEKILSLMDKANIVFWPCIMDFKYADVHAMPDGFIDVCFFNGAIRSEENAELARLLRRKAKIVVAYGSCAAFGGIPGLSNLYPIEQTCQRVYATTESTDNAGQVLPQLRTECGPGMSLHLPALHAQVRKLDQVVAVDYVVPGCPPVAEQTWSAITRLLEGDLPPRGTVLGAGDRSVCDECPFEKKGTGLKEFKRPHMARPEGNQCLLEQGFICLGPATRSGCGAACLTARMPCRGCYGPAGDNQDQGAKMISVLGSLLDTEDEEAISTILEGVLDLPGTLYRFGLPAGTLKKAHPDSGLGTQNREKNHE
ncbi:oxidoreductase [bacterium]|nr:oxidoreductase [bacterium]